MRKNIIALSLSLLLLSACDVIPELKGIAYQVHECESMIGLSRSEVKDRLYGSTYKELSNEVTGVIDTLVTGTGYYTNAEFNFNTNTQNPVTGIVCTFTSFRDEHLPDNCADFAVVLLTFGKSYAISADEKIPFAYCRYDGNEVTDFDEMMENIETIYHASESYYYWGTPGIDSRVEILKTACNPSGKEEITVKIGKD